MAKAVFTLGANIKFILCQNKSKVLPNSYPGVYALTCSLTDITSS